MPFHLQGDTRIDETPIHQALREALVNTLVHADYSDRASVRVIKRPSGFEFRNPGALRVPVAQALKGGESDCRNRTLQQMFLMINLGERAGSGLPRILTSWQSEGRLLKMTESFEPYDQSLLTMEWAMELAELNEKISGTQSNLGMVLFGPLGGFIHFSGFANAAAAEAALDAKSANTDWLPLFLKGTPYVLAGSVMSRQMTKLA